MPKLTDLSTPKTYVGLQQAIHLGILLVSENVHQKLQIEDELQRPRLR